MPIQRKNMMAALASTENLLLLGAITLAITAIILPLAEADLRQVTDGANGIAEHLNLSAENLNKLVIQYGYPGRTLYGFITITAGMAASVSIAIFGCSAGFWLQSRDRNTSVFQPWVLPLAYLLVALLEITFILVLLIRFPPGSSFLFHLLVVCSANKWGLLIIMSLDLMIPFVRYMPHILR